MNASPDIKTSPETGEIFELILDGTKPENQPLAITYNYGYREAGWRYDGQVISGREKQRFKLVSVGDCPNWLCLIAALKNLGQIPQGQWVEAFKATYPAAVNSKRQFIGIADNSWVDINQRRRFPALGPGGFPFFYWADGRYEANWLWLVACRR